MQDGSLCRIQTFFQLFRAMDIGRQDKRGLAETERHFAEHGSGLLKMIHDRLITLFLRRDPECIPFFPIRVLETGGGL